MLNRTRVFAFVLSAAFATLVPAQADMTDADRMARCANNQARVNELQRKLDSDRSYMSDEELARARTAMISAKKIQDDALRVWAAEIFTNEENLAWWERLQGMNRWVHVRDSSCDGVPLLGASGARMVEQCAGMIYASLRNSIDSHGRLRQQHAGLETEIARYRTNLAALQCGVSATLNIAGTWYREGDRSKPASVSGSGANLVFVNEFGQSAHGHVSGPYTVVADDWEGGLVGTITDGGHRIAWGNGTNWKR